MTTGIPLNQRAPAITLRLGGVATAVGTEINPVLLRNGGMIDFVDGNGGKYDKWSCILIVSHVEKVCSSYG